MTIKRDRWDRPLIIPVDEHGNVLTDEKPVAYLRPSSVAKSLDDNYQLTLWKMRKTAEGLLLRPDLMTRTAGVIAKGDPNTDTDTKKALNSITAQAIEAAGASKGSSAGTGFHDLTEVLDRGLSLPPVPGDDMARLRDYMVATEGIDWIDFECFVVNDRVKCAGTFDRVGRMPDGRVAVLDLKSGKSEAAYPLATTIQIAIYAYAQRYNEETGERSPIHPDLDLSKGYLIHLPPSGGCQLYELDILKGWKAAQVAAQIYSEIRKWKPADLCQPVFFEGGATMTQDHSTEEEGTK